MTAMMAEMRTMPAVVAADVMRAMPAVMTAHVVMTIPAVMVTILHLGRQTFSSAVHGRRNAGIVERDRVGLLRRRGHER